MGKLWIRQVKATKDDGTTSTIDLAPGLNCVVGPSNTGKTRIAKTITYACGGDELPFTAKTGYTTAFVTFVTPHGEVTLSRSIKPGSSVKVESTDPNVEGGTCTLNNNGKRPLNDLLIGLLGISPGRKVITNEAFKKARFTWKAIRHVILVPESEIGRPEPSILLPKSSKPQSQTQDLSALLVLAQGENFDDATSRESDSEKRARRKAVERYIYQQLDIIQKRLAELEQAEAQAAAEGTTIDAYLKILQTQLEQLQKQRQEILALDNKLIEQISDQTKELQIQQVASEQRRTLITQYDADLARLDLQLQGMRHDQAHPHPDTCQFCHSTIDAKPPTNQEITAFETEIARIRRLRKEVSDDLDHLVKRIINLTEEVSRNKREHNQLMTQLKRDLNPATRSIKEQVKRLSAAQSIKAEQKQLYKLVRRFERTLDGVDETETAGLEKFKPREHFDGDFYYSMTRSIQHILAKANFPGAQAAAFDRQAFDVEIAGYAKADEQGKGYCAFFNTVVALAFHTFMNRRSPHAPGFLLIDTPLHGFDEGSNTPDSSMRAGLFDYFAKQAKDQQIIILENTDRTQGLEFSEGTTVVEFSKSKTHGRYGYLLDVYDIAEEERL
ncbi:AAA family ATPase [Schaalia turicensis]|uniref:AAA family ATPase n=1 Tax=Schaalia turicensis TaxID=131111 RepID=UPI00189C16FB|nr:AAA family ATPase [Schaalia turicensis]